jgi:UDP-N-acetylmuramate dehydrogenase
VREDWGASLADFTTLRLGGPARRLLEATSAAEITSALRDLDAAGERTLVLAGGSNVVLPDAGFDGTVLLLRSTGVRIDGCRLTVAAGEPWDTVVEQCVAAGLAGLECLSGIPGSAGATPVQNVGAYGQEVADTLVEVRVFDRAAGSERVLSAAECGLSYRHSIFKHDTRYVVLEAAFDLRPAPISGALRFGELTRLLGSESAPLIDVREAVIALRRRKGMVLAEGDPDTRSVGSFFTNPVLTPAEWSVLAERSAEAAPRFSAPDGLVKTSAAWLIERAGFPRGYGRDGVGLSTKHTLALTNRGTGTSSALLALAREIRAGVENTFGITLVNEPVIVDDVL